MVFAINEHCICCGTCTETCIVNAISLGEEHYEIDENTCIGCGKCINICPIGAVYLLRD